VASGYGSHAEGGSTTASGEYSHAEGHYADTSGEASHAEGHDTTASGNYSHAEGYRTTASGYTSHTEGYNTTATHKSQHVQGEYNVLDTSTNAGDQRGTYAHIVGNGTSNSKRSNAHTLDWQGNAWYAGDVYTGSTSGTNRDEGSKKLATEEYVDSAISAKADKTDIVQGDWSQTDETAKDFIRNKPNEYDALELVAEMGLVSPTATDDGAIFTDENGNIYSL
jgi:hypothetical protein